MLSRPPRRNQKYALKKRVQIVTGSTIIIFAALVCFLVLSNGAVRRDVEPRTVSLPTPSVTQQTAVNVGDPVRLIIPSIGVDASTVPVGITADGAMDISQSQDDVAWYEPGPRPSESGSTVFAGHYGSLNGKFSVFSELSKLIKGDKIHVQDTNGTQTTFVVRESRMYDPAADAADVFVSSDGISHLNLVTCEGAWNNDKNSYDQRRVVFTDQEL